MVVVEFRVVLKKKIKDPLEPLRTRAMQNDFGIFTIDPNSVREKGWYIFAYARFYWPLNWKFRKFCRNLCDHG